MREIDDEGEQGRLSIQLSSYRHGGRNMIHWTGVLGPYLGGGCKKSLCNVVYLRLIHAKTIWY
jgi:hypothetical protein